MSLQTAPNFNLFIDRIYDMLVNSDLLMPNSAGGDNQAVDLVQQVIKYQIPIPENPPDGPGPPHIFISVSPNPINQRVQEGRDDRDTQGPERLTLEFYIIVVVQEKSFEESQAALYTILSAVETVLDTDKRMTDNDLTNPMSATSQWIQVPYTLNSTAKEMIAANIIFRPVVHVNMRG